MCVFLMGFFQFYFVEFFVVFEFFDFKIDVIVFFVGVVFFLEFFYEVYDVLDVFGDVWVDVCWFDF